MQWSTRWRVAALWLVACACAQWRGGHALPPATLGDAVANAATQLNFMKVTGAWRRLSSTVSESVALKHALRRLQGVPARAARLVHVLVDRMRVGGGPVVKTSLGSLRGRLLQARTTAATYYYSFKGIRYAQPPTGALRFKPPAPLEPWHGVHDALEEGAVCPHRFLLFDNYKGDEDCLFLNVYTPFLPDKLTLSNHRLPVMVWIHGGAFTVGSGNSFLYGADHLVGAGVVLVTLNYRLGALGFLSLHNDEVAGNMGLKDQVMALRWVRDNIEFFGGDPGRVTIFGESAGAVAVHYHMLAPASRGLFQQAVAQSGVVVAPWVLAHSPVSRAFALGSVLGIDTNSTAELLGYLRATPSETLVKASTKMAMVTDDAKDFNSIISLPFLPVVERDNSSGSAFLTEHPKVLLERGDIADVPFITGFNSEEGIIIFRRLQRHPQLLQEIEGDFRRVVPPDLTNNSASLHAAAARIRQYYFQRRPVDLANIDSLIDLFTDVMFVRPALQALELHAASNRTSPDYLYRFSFDGALGLYKRMLGITHKGTCHGDELGYLFYFGRINYRLDDDSPELSVTRHMVQMWTDFAKTGGGGKSFQHRDAAYLKEPSNAAPLCLRTASSLATDLVPRQNPTPKLNNGTLLGFEWLPVSDTSSPHYLEITGHYHLKQSPLERRMNFWKQLYKDFNK